MPIRRLLGVILLVAMSSLGLVAPASAAPYGPKTGSATVSKTRVVQGHFVTISGKDFCPGAAVRVTATQNGDTYRNKLIHANSSGVARTTLKLTALGRNHLKMTGCYAGPGGGTHVLTAKVRVVPHPGKLHASDNRVGRGATITVTGRGFCRNTLIKVRVYDDGHRYLAKRIHANSNGRATTSVKLTRAGRSTITFQGCRKAGGEFLKTTTVKVRKAHAFRSSPSAYVGDLAARHQPAAYAVAGGALVLLFGLAQLMFARRRRSS